MQFRRLFLYAGVTLGLIGLGTAGMEANYRSQLRQSLDAMQLRAQRAEAYETAVNKTRNLIAEYNRSVASGNAAKGMLFAICNSGDAAQKIYGTVAVAAGNFMKETKEAHEARNMAPVSRIIDRRRFDLSVLQIDVAMMYENKAQDSLKEALEYLGCSRRATA